MEHLERPMTRRGLLRAGAVGAAGIAVAGKAGRALGATQVDASGVTLNWLTWSDHYFPQQLQAVKKSTGIGGRVQLISDDSDGYIKVKQGGGHWDISSEDALWVPKFYKEGLKFGGHGHGHLIALLSLVEFATSVGDRDLLEFSKASFEWSKNPGPEYGVSTVVGWFPEFYIPYYPSCDADPQGDMLGIALKLTRAGLGDYWDDVDRWVRNQFTEQQLTSVDWVYRLAERSPRKPVAWNETADRVPERNLGAFGSSVSGNDWALGLASSGIAQCCTGSNTRSIYYCWEHILDYKDGQLSVNLLLNRASRWSDVYSYIPYHGRVDVKVKEEIGNVRVRAPEWVTAQDTQLKCIVNGAPRSVQWNGRYVGIGTAKRGDVISVTFPIPERTVKERIGPVTYTLVIKGNTVLSIDPPGRNGPLYQDREKYRNGEMQWHSVSRFAPEEEIPW